MDLIEIYIYIMLFIFGSVMGSFLNVLAVRLSKGESILWPSIPLPKLIREIPPMEFIPYTNGSLLFIAAKNNPAEMNPKVNPKTIKRYVKL